MSLRPRFSAGVAAAALLVAPPGVSAGATLDQDSPQVRQFIAEMNRQHGFEEEYLREIFRAAEIKPKIIEAISRPAERVKPWHEYRRIFLTERRIAGGVDFWHAHRDRLEDVAASKGVPPGVIVAILGVETYYGELTGGYRVIDALATLAFEYPPRSAFFRSELEQFLLLTREEEVSPLQATGSYAGAMGAPQFISSSYRAYAVDLNGDGRRDLWSSWDDVLGSVANYFTAHGWRPGEPVAVPASLDRPLGKQAFDTPDTVAGLRAKGVCFDTDLDPGAEARLIVLDGHDGSEYWVGFRNFRVITRYNNSRMYALAVHQLGEAITARMDDGRL